MNPLTVQVALVTRLTNSPSGNPAWRVVTEHGAFRTAPDSTAGYAVRGHEAGTEAQIITNTTGQIIDWTPVGKDKS